MHVAEAKRRTQSEVPWICDTMDNQIKDALGGAPNGELVLDPAGNIVRKRFWSDPAILRADLTELIGPVEKPTLVEELPVRFQVETREIASGVVPRIDLPRGLNAVKIEPSTDDKGTPFFVKLRAEATRPLIQKGKGQLYLGFYLDPLYKVHWNNRMGRIKVNIEQADGLKLEKYELVGPDVKQDSDIDPRQFLVDVELEDKNHSIELTVSYTVCDDAETFCVPVNQRYVVYLKRDKWGGTRPGIFLVGMFAEVEKMDSNGDGVLTKDELPPGRVTLYVGHMDKNGNGQIDADEISEFKAMFGNGTGFGTTKNDGG